MFMGEVKRLCPDVITLPYQFEDYRKTSQLLYDTVARYCLAVTALHLFSSPFSIYKHK